MMKQLVIPVVLISLAAAIFFMYTQPTYDEVQEVQAEVAKYDRALERSQELMAIREDLLSKYNAMETENLEKLNNMLPNNVDTVRLLIEIDEIASQYGMSVRNVSFSPDTGSTASGSQSPSSGQLSQPYQEMTMSFNVNATYEDFLGFLSSLENNLRIMDIQQISFSVSEDGVHEYSLSISTYWLSNS